MNATIRLVYYPTSQLCGLEIARGRDVSSITINKGNESTPASQRLYVQIHSMWLETQRMLRFNHYLSFSSYLVYERRRFSWCIAVVALARAHGIKSCASRFMSTDGEGVREITPLILVPERLTVLLLS